MVRLPLVWNKSITPGTGSICSSCDATQGFNSFHSYNHPFSKTDKCRWNSGPLGSLCHTSDNAKLNLKETVLFIHACLGVDRDRSFFMEEKWFIRLMLCTYMAANSIYSHRRSNTPWFNFSPEPSRENLRQMGQKYLKHKQIKRCHKKSGGSRDYTVTPEHPPQSSCEQLISPHTICAERAQSLLTHPQHCCRVRDFICCLLQPKQSQV